MKTCSSFYINGEWRSAGERPSINVINPASNTVVGSVFLGNQQDVDIAVAAARTAFESFSQTTREERIEILQRMATAYEARIDQMAAAICEEMGAPLESLCRSLQAPAGLWHIQSAIAALQEMELESNVNTSRVVKEPVGVCALITPWNWPANLIASKVAPAIAAGCTVVLKPSEISPLSANIFAEIVDDARVPAGVFNLVHGDGPGVGSALTSHPDVDLVSFTGSTNAGKLVAKSAADTVKHLALELGGKSANIILPEADLEAAVSHGVMSVMMNSGQTCAAPTRMLVPNALLDEVEALATTVAKQIVVGDPTAPQTVIGPVASEAQFEKIQSLIAIGIKEGAQVLCGGLDRPKNLTQGFYVRPTIFTNVSNDMTVAREEIFGPVLCIIGYDDLNEAVQIANDSCYGLAGYVYGKDLSQAAEVGRKLRAGAIYLNGADPDPMAPFGGYKQSGLGREYGTFGIEEFLEIKALIGQNPG